MRHYKIQDNLDFLKKEIKKKKSPFIKKFYKTIIEETERAIPSESITIDRDK